MRTSYPRMPKEGEDLIGKVCVCSVGRPAIVVGKQEKKFGDAPSKTYWIGIGIDGKGTWASGAPAIIADSAQEFHDRLVDRFGGKLSFLG